MPKLVPASVHDDTYLKLLIVHNVIVPVIDQLIIPDPTQEPKAFILYIEY